MSESLAGSRHSYGDVIASGNTRLFVGDYKPCNIRLENLTFNFSCTSSCDIPAVVHHGIWQHERASPTPTHDSTSTSNGKTNHTGTNINRQGYCRCEHNLFGAKRSDIRTDGNNGEIDMTYLHTMLGNATTTSTNNKHRRPKVEALVSRSKIVPKPAVVTSQPLGKCVVAQNSIAHQSSKAASTYGHDVKWGGNDDYYPNSVASLQTLVDAQISITFQDDLTKLCTYTRGDTQYRIFFLRKEGPDWTRSRCTESFMPASQINDRVKRGPTKSRQKKQNIKWTLEKLEPRRRSTSEHLLQEVNRCDPHGYKWCIVAIDNEDPMFTKRTKEVAVFSVILAKASDDPTSR